MPSYQVMSLERSMCAAEVENGAPPLPTKQDREKLSALLRRLVPTPTLVTPGLFGPPHLISSLFPL